LQASNPPQTCEAEATTIL